MRITFVIRDLGFGGAQRQLLVLASELVKLGHVVSVLFWRESEPFADQLRSSGVALIHVRSARLGPLGLLVRVVAGIVRTRPEVIHGYMPVENLVCSLASLFVPSAALVWGVRSSRPKFESYRLAYRLVFAAQRILSGIPDLAIANSHAGLELVPKAQLGGRAVVVPNGIARLGGMQGEGSRALLRSKLGFGDDDLVFAAVGRLDPMKGLQVFLAALSRVREQGCAAKGLVVGAGSPDYKAQLQKLAADLRIADSVSWLEPTPDIQMVYSAADVLVSASLYGEGFSNVLGEALGAGVSVVCTDVGSAREVVEDLGLVVPPGDVDALAIAMERAARSTSLELRSRRAARVTEKYAPELLARRTERLLVELVNRGKDRLPASGESS